MKTRYAGIDIGTNTLLMVIGEINDLNKLIVIRDEHSIARLGENVDSTNTINQNAIERASKILEKYKAICVEENVKTIRIVATSALRDAVNAKEVRETLSEIIESEIEIISGQQEAQLSFIGTINTSFPSTVIDIGGGSTEIITGKNFQEIIQNDSIDVGAVRLTERFLSNHPPDSIAVQKTRDEILKHLIKSSIKSIDSIVYGVAGTPTTLAGVDLKAKEFNKELIENHELSFGRIKEIEKEFLRSTKGEIIENLYVLPRRADIITAGTLILSTIMEFFEIESLIVSIKGLRFGVLQSISDIK